MTTPAPEHLKRISAKTSEKYPNYNVVREKKQVQAIYRIGYTNLIMSKTHKMILYVRDTYTREKTEQEA